MKIALVEHVAALAPPVLEVDAILSTPTELLIRKRVETE
jgi:hypothetical protein